MTTVTAPGTPASAAAPEAARHIVELACRAPSVHNTQPWLWRILPDRLELRADRRRQLTVADPTGRNLVISCGAALHHAEVAAAGLGWNTSTERLPDPTDPDLLATIRLSRGRATVATVALLDALDARRTDRRRFTSWPVPEERVANLAASVDDLDAQVVAINDTGDRFTADLLVDRAISTQQQDERLMAEQRKWVDHSALDGVPADTIPEVRGVRGERSNRFVTASASETSRRPVEGTDGLLAIVTSQDDPMAWLQTGEALSRLWLNATMSGLSVVPLSQVIELDETRTALRRQVFGGLALPQLLVRIGWQEISRRSLPQTPRRPVEDVLVP